MRAHYIILVCLALFLGFYSNVYSQVKINGVLQDSTDHSVLAYANIALLQLPDSIFITGTITDGFGKFTLKADSGSYFMRISYLGYGIHYLPLELNGSENEMNIGAIKISKSGENLGEVVITAKKPMYSYDGEKKIYNVSEDPSIQGGVATDALQNAPGVYVDMEGNITLRGVSGVEIWINDKPSRIKEEGLKSFLQQLPANSIQKIEVITNPSARYGAEGTAGIINIVTYEKIKRNQLLSFGFNASTRIHYSPWLSFVYANDKISINTYLSLSHFENESNSYSSGYVLDDGDSIYSLNNTSVGDFGYGWIYGHLSLTWEINKTNSLNFWSGASTSASENNNQSESIREMADGEVFAYANTSSGNGEGSHYYAGLSLEHLFKKEGHKFNIHTYAGSYINNSNSETSRLFSVQSWDNLRYKTNTLYDGIWASSELNYENPLGKNRSLEIGGEIGYNSILKQAPIDTFDFDVGQFLHVNAFSNYVDQQTLNGALYTTFSDTLWFISYKAGLRYEFAKLDMISVALDDKLHRTFGTFFPTLHLSTKTKNNDNYTLSYSRRVHYPQHELDPFANRVDPESVYFGNPWLDPAYTDAYEAAYAHFFKSGSSISASIYHRRTNLDITRKTEAAFDTLLDRYTVYTSYINAGKNIFTGADVTLTWRIKTAYRLMFNVNFYHQDIFADLNSYIIDKEDYTYNGKLIFMWNYKLFRVNIMGIYRAAEESMQGAEEASYWINANASADLFNRKMSLRFGMNDVFNWNERNFSISTPTFISSSSSKRKSQFLTFGITFRFGKLELEQQQKPPQNPMP